MGVQGMRIVLNLVMAGWALLATSGAHAQQGNTALMDGIEALEDLAYGLQQVCLPAQRAGQVLSEFEAAHRGDLKLIRMRVGNSTKVNMWGIGGNSDAAVLEDDAGCTASMSMWEKDAKTLSSALRGFLTANADQYEVVSGDPENSRETLVVAFCARLETGGVDSWYLYEYSGEPEIISGQRRPERQRFISLVVPTEPFCPQA